LTAALLLFTFAITVGVACQLCPDCCVYSYQTDSPCPRELSD